MYGLLIEVIKGSFVDLVSADSLSLAQCMSCTGTRWTRRRSFRRVRKWFSQTSCEISAVGDFGYLGRTLDAGHTYPARTEEWEVDLELRTVATSRQGVPACGMKGD